MTQQLLALPEAVRVSVVLVNFRGVEDTLQAVSELASVDWPQELLEIVVVENGSGDGSAERLKREAPHVKLVESPQNLGFAGGCNAGVKASSGDVVAFLNSDARPDAQWVKAAIGTFRSDHNAGAVASRVLDWDGETVDFVDAAVTWFGKGYKPLLGHSADRLGRERKPVLFGTGAALFVRRDVFAQVGGFDEDFFMFFEDVDLGWRINLLGFSVIYEPESVAYHRHHGAVSKFGQWREQFYLERNSLYCLYKNLQDDRLAEVLPASLLLTASRAVATAELDSGGFDYRVSQPDDLESMDLPKAAVASLFAMDQVAQHLPDLQAKRAVVQKSRRLSDADVWPLFGRVDAVAGPREYVAAHDKVSAAFDVTSVPHKTRVLIITGDPLGPKMAGPAIRAWNMAKTLSQFHDVALVTMSRLESLSASFQVSQVRAGDSRAFAPMLAWAEVVIFQGHALSVFPEIHDADVVVVADIYDPMHLEQLEQARALPPATWEKAVDDATQVLNDQLTRADFMICASERQRMFYLGQLSALGRVNPANYDNDDSLRSLLDVVPFGLEAAPPRHERAVLKGVHPGIGVDDHVLLWSGGLYNWFDPHTLIRAVADLADRRPSVKLFFQGTKHPHPGVPEMEIVRSSRQLASELGVLDANVFFNDSWIDYADRQNYLCEASVGVSTHRLHLETTFSFRTRILDYLWATLPMVVTEGDSFAELVETRGLGVVVAQGNPDELSRALERVIFDEDFAASARKAIAAVREEFEWSVVLQPLVDFVAHPRRAADTHRALVRSGGLARQAGGRRLEKRYGLRHNLRLVSHHLRHGGVRVVVSKVISRLRNS